MKNDCGFVLVMVGLLVPAVAQNSQLPLPSPVEKELAAKASNVTEVTLGKEHAGVCREVHERQGRG